MYLAFYFLGFFLSVFCFTKEESLSNTKSIFIFIFFHFCEEGENSDARDNVGFVSAGLSATRYPLDGADVPSVRNILIFFIVGWFSFSHRSQPNPRHRCSTRRVVPHNPAHPRTPNCDQ